MNQDKHTFSLLVEEINDDVDGNYFMGSLKFPNIIGSWYIEGSSIEELREQLPSLLSSHSSLPVKNQELKLGENILN
jgi:hypothetical protein